MTIQTRNWMAIQNSMNKNFYVKGDVFNTLPGQIPTLILSNPQGITETVLLLALKIDDDINAAEGEWVDVRYDEKYSTIVRYTEVQIVHNGKTIASLKAPFEMAS